MRNKNSDLYYEYLAALQPLVRVVSIVTGLLMIAILMTSSIFDFTFAPIKAPLFLKVRLLGSSIFVVLITFLSFLPWAKKEPKFFLSLMISTLGFINVWMFTNSDTYFPLFLVTHVILVFSISFYRFKYVIRTLSNLLLATLIWLWLSPNVSLIEFNITSYYLIGAFVISLVASYLSEKNRFKAYSINNSLIKEQKINSELLLELEQISKTDELTRIANRRHWQEVINKHWDAGGQFGIALIDIDKFKQVNDQSGHKAGDAALVEIAKIMQKLCTENDLAARLGGDELAILFAEKEFTDIYKICQELNHNVSSVKFKEFPKVSLSISIGIAIKEANDISYSVTMQRADKQLYLAKNNRGSICFANKHINSNYQTLESN